MAHYMVSGKVRTNRKLNAKGHENMNITSDRWSRNRINSTSKSKSCSTMP